MKDKEKGGPSYDILSMGPEERLNAVKKAVKKIKETEPKTEIERKIKRLFLESLPKNIENVVYQPAVKTNKVSPDTDIEVPR